MSEPRGAALEDIVRVSRLGPSAPRRSRNVRAFVSLRHACCACLPCARPQPSPVSQLLGQLQLGWGWLVAQLLILVAQSVERSPSVVAASGRHGERVRSAWRRASGVAVRALPCAVSGPGDIRRQGGERGKRRRGARGAGSRRGEKHLPPPTRSPLRSGQRRAVAGARCPPRRCRGRACLRGRAPRQRPRLTCVWRDSHTSPATATREEREGRERGGVGGWGGGGGEGEAAPSAAESATEWCSPAATAQACTVTRASISSGECRLKLSPWPSSPFVPQPQEKTSPRAVQARVWQAPQERSVTRESESAYPPHRPDVSRTCRGSVASGAAWRKVRAPQPALAPSEDCSCRQVFRAGPAPPSPRCRRVRQPSLRQSGPPPQRGGSPSRQRGQTPRGAGGGRGR